MNSFPQEAELVEHQWNTTACFLFMRPSLSIDLVRSDRIKAAKESVFAGLLDTTQAQRTAHPRVRTMMRQLIRLFIQCVLKPSVGLSLAEYLLEGFRTYGEPGGTLAGGR